LNFLTTVRHTGTTYFEKGFVSYYKKGEFDLEHISYKVLDNLDLNDKIYTTYRNPYRTAASWANRNLFSTATNFELWRESWGAYKELLKLNPIVFDFTKGQIQEGIDFGSKAVNSFNDSNLLHEALDNNDNEKLYTYIKQEDIDYAIECCGDLYESES